MKAVEVRDKLVGVLQLDLVGPGLASEHETEILPTPPSRWYLTGFLVPFEARESQRDEMRNQSKPRCFLRETPSVSNAGSARAVIYALLIESPKFI